MSPSKNNMVFKFITIDLTFFFYLDDTFSFPVRLTTEKKSYIYLLLSCVTFQIYVDHKA